ncbi:MAG: YHS domain-containing protein [Verrucomicrobia bacterium]|nr:YHS domain-containing protein [Verrucomicrobiota bacterium]
MKKRIHAHHHQAGTSAHHGLNFARWCVLAGLVLAGWLVAGPSVRAASPEQIAARAPVPALNNKDKLAVKGYDVVAYFADGRPVKGTANYSYPWQGATWQFASPEHRAAFMREPAKYAPQYGGYCAYAIALGDIVDIDPRQWRIVDGKLYLNNNPFSQSLWARDPAGYIKKGDANWRIVPRHPL